MGGMDRNEDGTRVMTASRLEDLVLRHGLTNAEAEQLFNLIEAGGNEDRAALAIRDARVVYRVHVERGYSPESDPLEVAKRKRMWEEAEIIDAPDKTAPEAGPYGASDYTEAATGNVTRAADLPS